MPFIAEFKSRWPALFMEHEASLESIITTLIFLVIGQKYFDIVLIAYI